LFFVDDYGVQRNQDHVDRVYEEGRRKAERTVAMGFAAIIGR
jgi:hypothetical protein